MRATFTVVVLLIACLLVAGCYAQSMGRSQYVGGSYGQSWISDFKTQNPRSTGQNLENSLWNWGGAPKGSIAVNGKLVPDPYYFWKSLNYTSGWLGKVYVDPSTGYPIYAYIDPYTGYPDYFYVEPNTGRPVYTNAGYAAGIPYYSYPYYSYGSASPVYSSNDWSGGYVLPPVFYSNNPWY